MSKVIDFNAYRRPELVLVLKDKECTVLHVIAPTQQLVKEFRSNLHELQTVLSKSDAEASRLVYHLAAKLMSCNLDNLTFTADELAKTYSMNLEDMAVFFTAYEEFLGEIENEKN